MAVMNEIALRDAVDSNRFSAEFFDPRYVFHPAPDVHWVPIGRALRKCQYGLSIPMNTVGLGFPIFRMNEIGGCFAGYPKKNADIPMHLFADYALQENDVLFNRTNSFELVGRTAIVKDRSDCTFASYLIRLVPHPATLLPEYLTVYLNTPFGMGQVKRRAMRSINQANVSGSEIQKVLIPLPPMEFQLSVAELMNGAFAARCESLKIAENAQHRLVTQLGLNQFPATDSIGYSTTLRELFASRRIDAQHFNPSAKKLIDNISSFDLVEIREIRTYNRRGIQPVYVPGGDVSVITSQHLGPWHINYRALQRTSCEHYFAAPEARLKRNDILTYSTGAYIGRTNVYLCDDHALASNHVNILRVSPEVNAGYLALVLQSIVGQVQTQKHLRGSAQAELYPTDIDRFVVPLLDPEMQAQIGGELRSSLQKLDDSERLTERAIAQVAEFIQQSIK